MPRRRPHKTPSKLAKRGLAFQELVATVIRAFDPDPNMIVKTEQWVNGPDGRRDMDVLVQGIIEGKQYSLLIECKDFNPKTTGKVGIQYIDALDSKRNDLKVNATMLCSNSGFTADAIRKAKRKNIGLISILKADDPHIRAIIEEEIYTRKIKISQIKMTIYGEYNAKWENKTMTFQGLPVENWIMKRIMLFTQFNKTQSAEILATHKFINPTKFEIDGDSIIIQQLDYTFSIETNWFSHIVILDASLGLYDYVRGKVKLAPGENRYIIKDIDIYNGKPIDFNPNQDETGIGLIPGEIDIMIALVEGIKMAEPENIPNLDPLIMPEDLELKLKSTDL